MRKVSKLLVCLVAVAMLTGALVAADAVSMKRRAQNKLLAARAARADAIRKLAERIRGLRITSTTSVKDFVAESDQINTAMTAFLSGMKEVGRPRHMEDGTCEVVMEVKLKTVIATLKRFHKSYYKGRKFKVQDFEEMTVTNKISILREVGQGAPRPELEEDPLIPSQGGTVSFSRLSGPARKFWMQYCTGQGRLMAERAARVDGMRRLAERIRGVRIDSRTTVRDFVAESDDINVSMRAFLAGAREVGVRYHHDELIVEVEMEVKLRTIYASLKTWAKAHYRGDRFRIQRLEELIISSKDTIIKETGMGVPPEKYLRGATAENTAVPALAVNAPPWVSQKLRAIGNGALDPDNANAAQAKLMAWRAAELDARRKLAEQLNGLMITSNTSVRDFVAQNDDIATSMLTFQQGASVVAGSQKLAADGTAEVTVEIELKPLWNSILYYRRRLSITIR